MSNVTKKPSHHDYVRMDFKLMTAFQKNNLKNRGALIISALFPEIVF